MKFNHKLKPEVSEYLHGAINSQLDSISGTSTSPRDIESAVKTALLTDFDNNELLNHIVDQAVRSAVSASIDAKSSEKFDEDQGALFNSSFMESILKQDDGNICKHKDANWDLMVSRRRRQQKHLTDAEKKLALTDSRMLALKTAGMQDDPKMTIGEAVKILEGRKR